MKTIPGPLQSLLDSEKTTLSLCWIITKRNGLQILGTDHDQDIVISSGPYAGTYDCRSNILPSNVKSSSDLSVDNLEVNGAVQQGTLHIDVSVADIEARNLDFAQVKTFFCNWADPDMGQVPMRTGYLGQITYDSNGQYKTEVRGVSQLLQQNIIQTYSDRCTVIRLGDTRCGVDLESLTISVTCIGVTSRKELAVDGITIQPPDYFALGNLTCVTGLNAGLMRQIRYDNTGGSGIGDLTLFEAFPNDIGEGDTFRMSPGCDRLISTCLNKFNNLPNFRGYGILIPGIDALMSGSSGQSVTIPAGTVVPPVSPAPVPPTPTGKTYSMGLHVAIARSQLQLGVDSGTFAYSNGTITISGNYSNGGLPGGHTGTTGSTSPKSPAITNNIGVLMRYRWGDVETSEGVYDWTQMDAELAQCIARGIQWLPMIEVRMFDGTNPAPAYLRGFTTAGSGGVVQMWRWNLTVVAVRWAAFMAAFGARYKNVPHCSGVVTQETSVGGISLAGTGYDADQYLTALNAEHDAVQIYVPTRPHIAFQNFMTDVTIAAADKKIDQYAAHLQVDGAVLAGPDLVRAGTVNSRCYGRAVAYHFSGTTASGVVFPSTGPTGQSIQTAEWEGFSPGPSPPETMANLFDIGTGVISGTPFTQHCDYLFYDFHQPANINGENFNNACVPLFASNPAPIGTWIPP